MPVEKPYDVPHTVYDKKEVPFGQKKVAVKIYEKLWETIIKRHFRDYLFFTLFQMTYVSKSKLSLAEINWELMFWFRQLQSQAWAALQTCWAKNLGNVNIASSNILK